MSKRSRKFLYVRLDTLAKGGQGSGNFHHKVRKGKRGGSEPDDNARLIEKTLKTHALPWRYLEFSEAAWRQEFPDGEVKTPIGVVKLGDRQHEKLRDLGRSRYFGLIRPTLENPTYAIATLETDERMADRKSAGEATGRASKLEFIRAFIKPDGEHQGFLCVTIGRDALEISVSSGPRRVGELAKKVKRGAILLKLPRQDQPQTLGVEDSYAKAATYSQFTDSLLKSNPDALALDILAKAEQLGLFDIPVPVKTFVRKDGTVVPGHVATRKKRIAPKGKQPDLFGDPQPRGEAVKLGRLGHFIERHGGYARLQATLNGFSSAQRDTLLDAMAKLSGKPHAEIVDLLANGAKHEMPTAAHDNQGRDLDATRRAVYAEKERHDQGREASHRAFEREIEATPLADWTEFEGIQVLRSGNSRYVGVPARDKPTAATFHIIDTERREPVVQVKRDEVRSWLWRAAKAEREEHEFLNDEKPKEPLRFDYPSLVDDEQRKRLESWHAAGADPETRPAERGIYLPGMSVGKLERLLQKDSLTAQDKESLKDYKYLLLAQPNDAAEKGFMVHVQGDKGGFLAPKNKFWLTNIDHALEGKAKTEPEGGRWHRVTPEKKPEFQATHELPDGTQVVANTDEPGVWVDARGDEYESDEAYPLHAPREGDRNAEGLVFHNGRWHREDGVEPQDRESSEPNALGTAAAFSDDDPNSPDYRYRDTGYVAGSRKEQAAIFIRAEARKGARLRATDIDWQAIETNPREAKELIIKSNLFGAVDWDALKAGGMEPGAGFLVDRVYASIATEPAEDSPQARHDYAIGLESLRDRLERCKTPDEVTTVLDDIRSEYDGYLFNADEQARHDRASAIAKRLSDRYWTLRKERETIIKAAVDLGDQIDRLKRDQDQRIDRKRKPDPNIEQRIAELKPEHDAALQAINDWDDAHPEMQEAWGSAAVGSSLRSEVNAAWEAASDIKAASLARNRSENPLHRAWALMGPKFASIMRWRRHDGSVTFQGHVTAAKTGKIKDWSWAEKDRATMPRMGRQKVRFQLRVVEKFTRVGGRPVAADSTAILKNQFNLREVQSGNWVLSDPESAAFHVQRSAEALSDLADLMQISDDAVSVNGRVALAFGARGRGSAGFGGAARAHYEPVQRVINITKMGGGGCLAHELFHAIDNLTSECETGKASGADDFITENPDLLPDGRLKDAVLGFRQAMLAGQHRLYVKIKYSEKDVRIARYNLDRDKPSPIAAMIKSAPDLETALRQLDDHYFARGGWEGPHRKRTAKNREGWRKIAAAWHDGMQVSGGVAKVRAGPPMSSYAYEAQLIDEGDYGKYWSSTHELASRAFQAWCEDRLSELGRRNDYLSANADNKYYKTPAFGECKPFPEGDERMRINAAIDRLVEAIRDSGSLYKAFFDLAR